MESPSLGGSEGNYSIIVDLIVYQLNYIILHHMIFVCAILYYTVLGYFGKEAAFALWAVLLCRLTGIDVNPVKSWQTLGHGEQASKRRGGGGLYSSIEDPSSGFAQKEAIGHAVCIHSITCTHTHAHTYTYIYMHMCSYIISIYIYIYTYLR